MKKKDRILEVVEQNRELLINLQMHVRGVGIPVPAPDKQNESDNNKIDLAKAIDMLADPEIVALFEDGYGYKHNASVKLAAAFDLILGVSTDDYTIQAFASSVSIGGFWKKYTEDKAPQPSCESTCKCK